MPKPDTIRAAVVDAAARLDLTAYAIAQRTRGVGTGRPVSDDQLRRYLAGTHDLTSARLDAVFAVLGLKPARA